MMPSPGLQIYLQPRTTLTFDPLTHKIDGRMTLLRRALVPSDIKIESFVLKVSRSQVWYTMPPVSK